MLIAFARDRLLSVRTGFLVVERSQPNVALVLTDRQYYHPIPRLDPLTIQQSQMSRNITSPHNARM